MEKMFIFLERCYSLNVRIKKRGFLYVIIFFLGGYLSFNEPQEFYFFAPKGARLSSTKYENNFHLAMTKLSKPMKSALVMGDNA